MPISKSGSALIAGVKASRLGRIVSGDAVERMNRAVGGAWIGGRLSVSGGDLVFSPSWLDRRLHEGLADITIHLSSVKTVQAARDRASGAIVIDLEGGRFCFRCSGAESAAEEFAKIVDDASRASRDDAV
ncbi:MAG: hypothetical protein QUS11_00675 [Candidatus Fermentibacter sp.]|nr:hypothetical protein [Candidatus Fermentibacter sp.]